MHLEQALGLRGAAGPTGGVRPVGPVLATQRQHAVDRSLERHDGNIRGVGKPGLSARTFRNEPCVCLDPTERIPDRRATEKAAPPQDLGISAVGCHNTQARLGGVERGGQHAFSGHANERESAPAVGRVHVMEKTQRSIDERFADSAGDRCDHRDAGGGADHHRRAWRAQGGGDRRKMAWFEIEDAAHRAVVERRERADTGFPDGDGGLRRYGSRLIQCRHAVGDHGALRSVVCDILHRIPHSNKDENGTMARPRPIMDTAPAQKWRGHAGVTTFKTEDASFSIFTLKMDNPADKIDSSDEIKVRFNGAAPKQGTAVSVDGHLIRHAKYGLQIEAATVTPEVASRDGLLAYLSSGSIPGIGGVRAQMIVDGGGEALFSDPQRLAKVSGVPVVKAQKFCESWREQVAVREAMIHLQGLGLGPKRAGAVVALHRGETLNRLKRNPYDALLVVRGIGFALADQVALASGVPADAPMRIQAAIVAACDETMTEKGDTLIEESDLVAATACMTQQDAKAILTEIAGLKTLVEIIVDGCRFYSTIELHNAECAIAKNLDRLQKARPLFEPRFQSDHALVQFQRASGKTLTEEQRQAVEMAHREKIMILTGGPGVGKTTTLYAILDMYEGARIFLCAPSARAAKRMSEATGREAATVHRTLGVVGQDGGGFVFRHNARNRLPADLVVMDESSMTDAALARSFLAALPDGCRVLFVGDPDQLPSVAPGNVLADIIRDGRFPVARLTEIRRQARGSQIAIQASRINRGESLDEGEKNRDFFAIKLGGQADSPAEVSTLAAQTILAVVKDRLPAMGFDPIRDVQVLTPMHAGPCGTVALNTALQSALNPFGTAVVVGDRTFRVGDKVCQTVNNSDLEVFNGDIGTVSAVGRRDLTVSFPDGREARYVGEDLQGLMLGYAVTVHKSQGSEFRAVVLPVLRSHYKMLEQQILYTGLTRGKDMVVLLYEPKALGQAIRTGRGRNRSTALPFLLRKLRPADNAATDLRNEMDAAPF